MGRVGEILFLTEESAAGKQRLQPLCQEMLDGDVGRGDEVFPASFLLNGKTVPGHQAGCFPDDSDDVLDDDIIHRLSIRMRRYS